MQGQFSQILTLRQLQACSLRSPAMTSIAEILTLQCPLNCHGKAKKKRERRRARD